MSLKSVERGDWTTVGRASDADEPRPIPYNDFGPCQIEF